MRIARDKSLYRSQGDSACLRAGTLSERLASYAGTEDQVGARMSTGQL